MIDIARERLPKEYERVILEEYYNLFYDDIALAINSLNEQRPDLHIIKEV